MDTHRQYVDNKAARYDEFDQVARVLATNELTICTSCIERVRQRQTSHDVAGADLQRCVGAEYDLLHVDAVDSNGALTGMPLDAIASFAPRGVCSVKWNMLAAATAEAPA